LRCPHPLRAAQRQRFLTVTLHNFYHKSNTAQPVRELISRNLMQWFQNPTLPHRTARTNPLYRASVHQQAIGWQHFLRGRIAQSIIDYQEVYYRERERPPTENGQTWAKKLIQVLWTHFFAVWKTRCDKRHELDVNHVSQQHTAKVQARVRAAFSVLERLPVATRNSHYFDKTMEHQIMQPTRALEIWLAHAEPLIQQGLVEAAQAIATGHFDIREYFPTLAPPSLPD
jgi:hypothetical protein